MHLKSIVPLALAAFFVAPIIYAAPTDVLDSLSPAIHTATTSFDQIPDDRKLDLKKIALFVQSKIAAGEPAQVTFICTANSRRSLLAQTWAQTAATYYGVSGFKAFSGGIEVTACNERTVAALKRAGFDVAPSATEATGTNPVYLVKYSKTEVPIRAFSKMYNAPGNPSENFLAAMTCDKADKNCPVVQGSSLRVPIHYVDPKVADGTPQETAVYDERTQQIAREMFYMMSLVKGS